MTNLDLPAGNGRRRHTPLEEWILTHIQLYNRNLFHRDTQALKDSSLGCLSSALYACRLLAPSVVSWLHLQGYAIALIFGIFLLLYTQQAEDDTSTSRLKIKRPCLSCSALVWRPPFLQQSWPRSVSSVPQLVNLYQGSTVMRVAISW